MSCQLYYSSSTWFFFKFLFAIMYMYTLVNTNALKYKLNIVTYSTNNFNLKCFEFKSLCMCMDSLANMF